MTTMKTALAILLLCGVLSASDHIYAVNTQGTRHKQMKLDRRDPIGSVYKCWDFLEPHRTFPFVWRKRGWGGGTCWIPAGALASQDATLHDRLARRGRNGEKDQNVSVGILHQ